MRVIAVLLLGGRSGLLVVAYRFLLVGLNVAAAALRCRCSERAVTRREQPL
jgi:hypothetical protein